MLPSTLPIILESPPDRSDDHPTSVFGDTQSSLAHTTSELLHSEEFSLSHFPITMDSEEAGSLGEHASCESKRL